MSEELRALRESLEAMIPNGRLTLQSFGIGLDELGRSEVATIRKALALIDHLEADGGVEAMREAIDAGLKSFVRDQPDFDMSRRMRQDAIDHIIAQPGLYSALPVLGVGR